jgi:hypothetical protein
MKSALYYLLAAGIRIAPVKTLALLATVKVLCPTESRTGCHMQLD